MATEVKIGLLVGLVVVGVAFTYFVAPRTNPAPDPVSVSLPHHDGTAVSPSQPRRDTTTPTPAQAHINPPAPAASPTLTRSPAAQPDTRQPPAPTTYVVKPGDTLSSIAASRLGSAERYNEIYQLNRDRLKSPDDLKIGQTLKLPP